eukprot:scaffold2912_cov67-Attheya_sp.AAC.2
MTNKQTNWISMVSVTALIHFGSLASWFLVRFANMGEVTAMVSVRTILYDIYHTKDCTILGNFVLLPIGSIEMLSSARVHVQYSVSAMPALVLMAFDMGGGDDCVEFMEGVHNLHLNVITRFEKKVK